MSKVPPTIFLKYRTSLLEFSQAGSVEPHRVTVLIQLGHLLGPPLPSLNHLPRFLMAEEGNCTDTQCIKPNPYSI